MGLGLRLGSGLGLEVGLGVRVRGQGWVRQRQRAVVACNEYIHLDPYLYACDESASKDWPRESVRGMQSMAKHVAFCACSCARSSGLPRRRVARGSRREKRAERGSRRRECGQ